MNTNICLIGGTGLVGSLVLSELQKNASIEKIYFIGRRPPQNFSKVEFIKIELSEISILDPISAEHWICCLGTTIKAAGSQNAFRKVDFQAVLDFSELAKKSKAQSLHIVSALGADENSPIFYNKTKGQMEKQVEKFLLPSLNIYRPSLLLGHRTEFRPSEKIAMLISPILKPFLLGAFKKSSPIPVIKVAQAMIRNISNPKPGVQIIENQEML